MPSIKLNRAPVAPPVGYPLQSSLPLPLAETNEAQRRALPLTAGVVYQREGGAMLPVANPPPETADTVVAMQQDVAAGRSILPVPLNTPKVKLTPVDIGQLNASQQRKYQEAIHSAVVPAAAAPVMQPAPVPQSAPVPPSRPISDVAQKVLTAEKFDIPTEEPASQTPAAIAAASGLSTLTHCPRCRHDLSAAFPTEPTREEKLLFKATMMLGDNQPFTKMYSRMKGEMQITFRSLTVQEIDACFAQAQKDLDAGRATNIMEKIERIRRYHTFLQLRRLKTTMKDIALPAGLAGFNHNAEKANDVWETTTAEPLLEVEKYILDEVLATAPLARIVQASWDEFNLLCSKLEAMAAEPDFW